MVQNDCHDPEWARYLAGHHSPLPLHTIQGSDRADEIRQLRQNRARLGQSVILSEVEGFLRRTGDYPPSREATAGRQRISRIPLVSFRANWPAKPKLYAKVWRNLST